MLFLVQIITWTFLRKLKAISIFKMTLISKLRLWEAPGVAELLSKVAMLEETLLEKPRPQH